MLTVLGIHQRPAHMGYFPSTRGYDIRYGAIMTLRRVREQTRSHADVYRSGLDQAARDGHPQGRLVRTAARTVSTRVPQNTSQLWVFDHRQGPATITFDLNGTRVRQTRATFTVALRRVAEGWRVAAWAKGARTP